MYYNKYYKYKSKYLKLLNMDGGTGNKINIKIICEGEDTGINEYYDKNEIKDLDIIFFKDKLANLLDIDIEYISIFKGATYLFNDEKIENFITGENINLKYILSDKNDLNENLLSLYYSKDRLTINYNKISEYCKKPIDINFIINFL